ncbi:hypothetical protein FJM67_13805 [Maribrevibacterium harenarium]|uniref:Uncharacterized protein n=1 Tax=Maribrevibacterium harenarium TaxID=2589817 RepID=A0A501WLB4_9GAMM|nr:hypothetical protein [Maribrevibacterium harenarium]TPE48007.1 hypothetical protein FJM67_13805 [Maribrevibacterium harenarium]
MKVAVFRLNQVEKFMLAIVIVDPEVKGESEFEGPYYVKTPFTAEPDFGVASINYDLSDLLSKAVVPEQTV